MARDPPYRVQALVRYASRNAGEVVVIFRLIESGGLVVTHSTIGSLEGNDRVVVIEEVIAPPGDYKLEAKAVYPSR